MNFRTRIQRANLLQLLKNKALYRGEFTLSSGSSSNYYIDCKEVTLAPTGAFLVASVLSDKLSDVEFDSIGGPVSGATPIVSAYVLFSYMQNEPKRGFLVLKESSSYGLQKMIEGHLGKRVVLVDDVITSGLSLERAIRTVIAFGSTVVKVITLVDRFPEGKDRFIHEYDFETIFTRQDLGMPQSL